MELPEYVSEPLARSPLVLVAAQVNFEEIGREVTHGQARQFQRLLGAPWSELASAPLMQATMTPGGVVSEPNRQAYRLSTADESWSLLINPNVVTVETRTYPGWAGFQQVFAAVARALAQVFDPAAEQRLGIRYVDQIPLPDGHREWTALVRESLLGLTQDPAFAGDVLASDQRVLLQLEEDARCVLRHGQLADPTTGKVGGVYLLDFDVYREGRPFDAASAMDGVALLHRYVGKLFKACITDELHKWLKG